MKLLRIVALAAFVVLCTVQAHADSIPTGDPVIRSGGGSGSVPITFPTFFILTPTGSSPTDGTDCFLIQGGVSTDAPGCFFSNHIMTGQGGATIDALVFVVSKASFSGTLSCALSTALGGDSPWFTNCAVSPAAPVVTFSGGPGIPFGDEFSMGFRGFQSNTTFVSRTILSGSDTPTILSGSDTLATPEPGTLALFVGGLGALLVGRRLGAG
jgi:hypothetical protein